MNGKSQERLIVTGRFIARQRWLPGLGLILGVIVGTSLVTGLLGVGSLRSLSGHKTPEGKPAITARPQTNVSAVVQNPRTVPWLFDLVNQTAAPIQLPSKAFPDVGSVTWVNDASVLAHGPAGFGVVTLGGDLELTLPSPNAGLVPPLVVIPLPNRSSLLVWRSGTSELSLIDVPSGNQAGLKSLVGASDFSLSPSTSALAFTRKRADHVEVVLLSLADLHESVVFTMPGERAALCCLQWSKDGTKLLVQSGQSSYLDGLYRLTANWEEHIVFELSGRIIWRAGVSQTLSALLRVHWVGSDRLFVATSGSTDRDARTEGYFVDPERPGDQEHYNFPGWLRCVSPMGDLALVVDGAGRHVIWDLANQVAFMTVGTGNVLGNCSWSGDGRFLIASAGD